MPSRSPHEHPYRSASPSAAEQPVEHDVNSIEEVVVHASFAFVGALGVIIGVLAPERTVEPSLGLCVLVFVVATLVAEHRRRRRIARDGRALRK